MFASTINGVYERNLAGQFDVGELSITVTKKSGEKRPGYYIEAIGEAVVINPMLLGSLSGASDESNVAMCPNLNSIEIIAQEDIASVTFNIIPSEDQLRNVGYVLHGEKPTIAEEFCQTEATTSNELTA